jgi:hypothetical protein
MRPYVKDGAFLGKLDLGDIKKVECFPLFFKLISRNLDRKVMLLAY